MTGVELALLVLLGTAISLDEWPAFQTMASRPIVVGPLTGLALGAPGEGAVWGAVFEAIHLGFLPVGAARVPSAGLSALAGTATAILALTGGPVPAALAVAVGIVAGEIGMSVDHLQRRWNGATADRVRRRVEGGDPGAVGRGVGAALAQAAVLGVARTAVALGVAVGAVWFFDAGPWSGRVPPGILRQAAAAAAAVVGARVFVALGKRRVVWGVGVAFGAALAWLGSA